VRAAALALALGGCIPAVPFVVGETAETLKAREVSAAVYGGGGAFTGSTGSSGGGCCGGVMGRVRVGVGRSQEVGAEGGVYLSGGPGNGSVWGTAKLAWKLQLNEHYAVVGGVGTTFIGGTVGLGGDAGVIASTSPWRESISLYAGLRATMMIDTGGAISDGGGVLSGGISYALPRHLRVAVELGAIGGGAHNRQTGSVIPENSGWFGGYGAALVSYAWRR